MRENNANNAPKEQAYAINEQHFKQLQEQIIASLSRQKIYHSFLLGQKSLPALHKGTAPFSWHNHNQPYQPKSYQSEPANKSTASLQDLAKPYILQRAQADFFACEQLFHNGQIFENYCPISQEGRLFFLELEKARIFAQSFNSLFGVAQNMEQLFLQIWQNNLNSPPENWPFKDIFAFSAPYSLSERPRPLQIEAAYRYCAAFIKEKAPQTAELWQKDKARLVREQSHFAKMSLALLAELEISFIPAKSLYSKIEENEHDCSAAQKESQLTQSDKQKKGQGGQDNSSMANNAMAGEESFDAKAQNYEAPSWTSLAPPSLNGKQNKAPQARDLSLKDLAKTSYEDEAAKRQNKPHDYKIFTTAFDEIINAQDLASKNQLDELAKLFAGQLRKYQDLSLALAHRLQRQLMAQQQRSWLYGQEEGMLDSAKLPQIIIRKDSANVFKAEADSPFLDTAITLLLDNSGSMRGQPILLTAICAAMLSDILERCQIKVEILGFTTKEWKGGKSRQSWISQGKPHKPGRLNELRHIIYKPANSPARRAKRHLALMLKEGLLKENIDGEALLWAQKRLLAHQARRKILIVISDGAPIDDATLAANGQSYLEDHLHKVIKSIETGPIELLAIGIGHDVTRYYSNAIMINDSQDLAHTLLHQLLDIFSRKKAAKSAKGPIGRRALKP